MEAMMFFELGCKGHLEMSVFQGLSAGNTCKASRIRSAWGVLNRIGLVISGIFASARPLECLAAGASSLLGMADDIPRPTPNERRLRRSIGRIIFYLSGMK